MRRSSGARAAERLLKSGLKRRGIVRTTMALGNRSEKLSTKPFRPEELVFFSHDGQNEPPRQENATTKLVRQDSQ
jgi:hypothetical protein